MRSTSSGSRPTSAQVAERAGVSRPTVSQILNGHTERFAPDTVALVQAAAEDLGYRPSVVGRALVTGRSDIAVLAVPYVTLTEKVQDAIDAATDRLAEAGLLTVLAFLRPGTSAVLRICEQLRPSLVVALGVLPPRDIRRIERAGAVIVGGTEGDAVGAAQAEHLAKRGVVRIDYAFLSDTRDDAYGPGRAAAVARRCAVLGLPRPRGLRIPLDPESAAPLIEQHLQGARGKLGLACYNDEVGAVVVAAAAAAGIDVPGRLAVIGVDNAVIGRVCSPQLTTVDFDARAVIDLHVDIALAGLRARRSDKPVPEPSLSASLIRLVQRGST